jgi:hypothetical protein
MALASRYNYTRMMWKIKTKNDDRAAPSAGIWSSFFYQVLFAFRIRLLTPYSLLITHYSLLITHYSLLLIVNEIVGLFRPPCTSG